MTNRTILELHILQTVPPSNLNRDDTGSPKTAVYGGVRRARVSSQAWKRATRRAFDGLLDARDLGVRTKRVAELLADRIRVHDPSIEETQAWALAAETIQSATGSKIETPKRKASAKTDADQAAPESKYLMFLSARQLDGLAQVAIEARDDVKAYFKDKDNKTRARQVANTGHSVDIALFGRMVADGADINVDAAAQVAHAISVHQADNESDYYTAVDDRKNRETDDLGAGMIGTVEFNSATLYRYAAVDVDLLGKNLGKGLREDEPLTDPVRRAVEAFTEGFITSLPTGKLNTFGNHTLPDAVIIKLRSSRPINLVAAFEQPCRADQEIGGHLRQACERLAAYIPQVEHAYGLDDDARTWVLRVGANTDPLTGLGTELALGELIDAIGTEVAQRVKDQA
ncbi:type I-E CRISPR-associated protein Cas7/Cse4/CasC [Actinomadura sp. DC4]|uniref:type I-E CRISPR-associated protein Cas7/Cse4/CasC n=1 Tax=Actinomadura sp. DC4 TaxID=3055069 RepID=UPI0025AFB3BE|nr:type I-E CRISPR-associated protein Cas7/Cse4/CasC [Actinomadura sp. DC4]MDN3357336.1 type I-E CRISPR-associated protein Cas7/Cse4/CasC [Actinomadura sp. DC4]